jgi:3-oxoacyl-[acyl-carrier-protein] synthase-3
MSAPEALAATPAAIHLAGLAFELGAAAPINGLSIPGQGVVLADLKSQGFRDYRRSEVSTGELAMRSLEKTLALWTGDINQIDLILYCSNSFSPDDKQCIADLCGRHSLAKAPVLTLGFSGCANLMPALTLARAMIRSEGLRNVAVVTADRAAQDKDRIAMMDFAILADGAASCIVSAEPRGDGFALLGLNVQNDNRLRRLDYAGQKSRALLMTVQGMRAAARHALAEASLEAGSLSHVIMANIRKDSQEFFAQQCGLRQEAVFQETLPTVSHCYAADPIINLVESAAWRARDGHARDPILVMGLSPYKWGAFVAQPSSATAHPQ